MAVESVWLRIVAVTEEAAAGDLQAVAVDQDLVDAPDLALAAAAPEADQSHAMVALSLQSNHVPVRDQCKFKNLYCNSYLILISAFPF